MWNTSDAASASRTARTENLFIKLRSLNMQIFKQIFTLVFSVCIVTYVAEVVRGCILFFLLKSEILLFSSLPKRAVPIGLSHRP